MTDEMINAAKIWEVSNERGVTEINLPTASNLDTITRTLPQGFYTTFRTYDNRRRVLGLRAHLRRFYLPAADQGITPSVDSDRLREKLAELLQNYPDEVRARLIMAANGQFYVILEPLKLLPAEIYQYGVKIITIDMERQNPRLKSTAFISNSQNARRKIAESNVFEALLMRNGSITEGMTSNFFYVKDGILGTARRDILLGVTRRTVLQVARGSGLEIVYKPLKQEQIKGVSETFLTSSSRGIVPIVQIDEIMVGEGVPGEVTGALRAQYTAYIISHAEKIV